ncbi:MAG: hypothetical protein IPK97_19365 [Ahniella sp.]|nr:hypothetical protein [Ahniella sp.]
MAFLFGFMGALAGLFIAFAMEAEGLGFMFGAVLGGLFGAWINLRDRVGKLEQRTHDLHVRLTALSARQDTRPTAATAPEPVRPPAFDDRGVPLEVRACAHSGRTRTSAAPAGRLGHRATQS